jgi:CHAD domain-containing protein
VTTAGQLLRAYVAHENAALVSALHHPDRPADVHRTRVAARRLRSVLGAYDSEVPPMSGLRRDLRWLGARYGDLRQLDVLRDRLAPHRELADELDRDRDRAIRKATKVRRKSRAERTLAALAELLDEEVWVDVPQVPAELVAARVVAQEEARVLGRAEVAELPGVDRDEALHDVRKAAKRLRYAAEAARPALPRAAEVAATAEALQEILGAHNDEVAARTWLADLASRRPDLASACAAATPGTGTAADLPAYRETLARLGGK